MIKAEAARVFLLNDSVSCHYSAVFVLTVALQPPWREQSYLSWCKSLGCLLNSSDKHFMNSTEFRLVLRPLGLSATFWQRFLESISKERIWKIIKILLEHGHCVLQCLITPGSLAVRSRPTDGLLLRLAGTSGTDDKLRLSSTVLCCWPPGFPRARAVSCWITV